MTLQAMDRLLSPLGTEAPTGENLEYAPEFLALERAAAIKGERAVGDSVRAAEEPDWDKVQSMAEALLDRSKDLRVAVHLTTSWVRTNGLQGWSDGLGLIRGLLENFWDSVHPQLDAEDDNDPTARVNAVLPISDPQGALASFRTTPFVQSARLGRFSLRDLRIANGTLKVASGDEASGGPSITEIEAACLDCPEDLLIANAAAISAALEHAKIIDTIFNENLGTAGPDLKSLIGDVYELNKFLQSQVARRAPEGESVTIVDEGDGASAVDRPAGSSPGRIESPQDVIRRIDEICDYYARSEPSSPIPLLLRRAQRLVGLSFVDLMKDLAPGGISELQVISGTSDEE